MLVDTSLWTRPIRSTGFLLTLLLCGCAAPAKVISTDLTRVSGVYVVGYVEREDVRERLEDRFVADLASHGMRAIASRTDISAITRARVTDVIEAANGHQVAGIVLINRVDADGAATPGGMTGTIRPDDPDLLAYLEATRQTLDVYGRDEPIYAVANAFLLDGSRTRRIWTGTSWTFADEDAAVIGSISSTIAAELAKAAQELRSYGRPMGER
jgi:hypothetical protein